MTPKISVIVPVYNTEKYLRKCLNSLLNQTWTNMEIIVVDDGSTDSSGHIVTQLQEQYPDMLKYIFQENAGQGKARNLGIQMSTGDYIGFLDSDDYANLEMFEDMVMRLITEEADYVACGYTEFYEDDNGNEVTLRPYVASKPCGTAKKLYYDVWVDPWLHLYRADIVRKSGVKFPERVIYEDIAFFVNLIPYLNKVAYIETAYVHHRKHRNSTMGNISINRVRNIFPVIDAVRKWYDSHDLDNDYKKLSEYVCVRLLLCSSVERISQLKTFSERQRAIRETLDYIRTNYKDYRDNPEMQHGLRSIYMRTANQTSVTLMCEALKLRKRRAKYS